MLTQLKNSFKSMSCSGVTISVSKKFPMLASPRLYLGIFFQIYGDTQKTSMFCHNAVCPQAECSYEECH
jgi:hypothetical protein